MNTCNVVSSRGTGVLYKFTNDPLVDLNTGYHVVRLEVGKMCKGFVESQLTKYMLTYLLQTEDMPIQIVIRVFPRLFRSMTLN